MKWNKYIFIYQNQRDIYWETLLFITHLFDEKNALSEILIQNRVTHAHSRKQKYKRNPNGSHPYHVSVSKPTSFLTLTHEFYWFRGREKTKLKRIEIRRVNIKQQTCVWERGTFWKNYDIIFSASFYSDFFFFLFWFVELRVQSCYKLREEKQGEK